MAGKASPLWGPLYSIVSPPNQYLRDAQIPLRLRSMSPPKPALKLRKSSVLAISPSGKYLAQIAARIFVLDLNSKSPVSNFKCLPNESHICFSPDDQLLAVKNTRGQLAFCDVVTGSVIASTDPKSDRREGGRPAFLADGAHVIDGDWSGVLRRTNTTSGETAEAHQFGFGYMFGDAQADLKSGNCVVALNAKNNTRDGSRLLRISPGQPLGRPTEIKPLLPVEAVEGGWRHIDRIALQPGGDQVALALMGRSPEEPNSIAILRPDGGAHEIIQLPSRMHFVHGLAWSCFGALCAIVHEVIDTREMGFKEWRALDAASVRDRLTFYSDVTLTSFEQWPWRHASSIAFTPNGQGFAVTGGESAFFVPAPAPGLVA